MINLIPDYYRANNRYALRNLHLMRYTTVSFLTMAAIAAVTILSILGMLHTQSSLQKQIDTQEQKLAVYKPLEAQGQQLSDQISTISSLLNRQVTFSTLLPSIAKIMPNGAILKELDFSTSDILATSKPATGAPAEGGAAASAASVQKPFVIQAAVHDRATATTLLENVKASKDLFTDADLVDVTQNLTENAGTSTFGKYPYQVTINAYLKKVSSPTGASK
jgi:Tfp pilus assembly protein PilN